MCAIGRRLKVLGVAALVVLSVSACSVTEYKGEIEAFAKATKTAEEAFLQMQKDHAAAHGGVEKSDIVSNDATDRLTTSDPEKCAMGAPNACGVFLLDPSTNKNEPFPPRREGVNGAKLMKAYRVYGERLVVLTNAKDAEAVENVAAGLTSAIGDLAITVGATINPIAGAAVKTGVGAIEGVVRWTARSYVEQKRFVALQDAVQKTQPLFKLQSIKVKIDDDTETTVLEALNSQIWLFLRGRLLAVEAEILNAKQRLDVTAKAAREAGIGDESAESARLQLIRQGEAGEIFDRLAALSAQSRAIAADQSAHPENGVLAKMAKAHGKLLEALNDDKTTAKLVFDVVGDFAKAVDKAIDLAG